jgi:hypothetical protein
MTDTATYNHLSAWSESGQAPYGYAPALVRVAICDYLDTLDAAELDSTYDLGWSRVFDIARSLGFTEAA